ncbi:MAG: helix-turn-helix transcriptional regulator [Clostridia bacterium]|nr:helix-turn-helix transcriptional regulator [Clostridia bacterium]
MEWLSIINDSIEYIEGNLTNDFSIDDICSKVYVSSSNFQRIFSLVIGITVGDYIRYRRLSEAGQDMKKNNKVIDAALKYRYDSPESFCKAFYRFYGFNPSQTAKQSGKLKYFSPLKIQLSIKGGYSMANKSISDFYWSNLNTQYQDTRTDKQRYDAVVRWAIDARRHNPTTFDNLTDWILDDSEWTKEKLEDNKEILMVGILGRFKEQNQLLRTYLKQIKEKRVVNNAAYTALDRFDEQLFGLNIPDYLQNAVKTMFTDFDEMSDKNIRKLIAGERTGIVGVDSVNIFGYINVLKECDASVQWTLFMPEYVKRQQKGFEVASFEYCRMDAFRFVGFEGEEYFNVDKRMAKMKELDQMKEYRSGFNYDLFLMHHGGANVDVPGAWRGIWGRIMKQNAPVPDGYVAFDFVPEAPKTVGFPFISQFALAKFTGDIAAMHSHEGYDMNAMYDVTRNIILAQNVCIPYPEKYWTAEVFLNGCDNDGTGYMFSVIKDEE